jgi:hypothetical protein
MNFNVFIPSGSGRGSYKAKYSGQVISITNKGYIWVSEEVVRLLGNPTSVKMLYDTKEWAVAAANDNEPGAYKFSKDDKESRIRCSSFIKSANLPVGYLYRGRLVEGMVVFSKTPTEQV